MSDVAYLVAFKSGETYFSPTFDPASMINHDDAMRKVAFIQRVPAPVVEDKPEPPQ